jgi:hypothetical protein
VASGLRNLFAGPPATTVVPFVGEVGLANGDRNVDVTGLELLIMVIRAQSRVDEGSMRRKCIPHEGGNAEWWSRFDTFDIQVF